MSEYPKKVHTFRFIEGLEYPKKVHTFRFVGSEYPKKATFRFIGVRVSPKKVSSVLTQLRRLCHTASSAWSFGEKSLRSPGTISS